MKLYANIIIDISLEKLDRTFQYEIPEEMQHLLQPGMQVKVPFGKGNRFLTGYVIEVTEKPEFDPEKIKPVAEILPESIQAPNQMLMTAAWMRRNYGGTMNQALKTVLPVKRRANKKVTGTYREWTASV